MVFPPSSSSSKYTIQFAASTDIGEVIHKPESKTKVGTGTDSDIKP